MLINFKTNKKEEKMMNKISNDKKKIFSCSHFKFISYLFIFFAENCPYYDRSWTRLSLVKNNMLVKSTPDVALNEIYAYYSFLLIHCLMREKKNLSH